MRATSSGCQDHIHLSPFTESLCVNVSLMGTSLSSLFEPTTQGFKRAGLSPWESLGNFKNLTASSHLNIPIRICSTLVLNQLHQGTTREKHLRNMDIKTS